VLTAVSSAGRLRGLEEDEHSGATIKIYVPIGSVGFLPYTSCISFAHMLIYVGIAAVQAIPASSFENVSTRPDVGYGVLLVYRGHSDCRRKQLGLGLIQVGRQNTMNTIRGCFLRWRALSNASRVCSTRTANQHERRVPARCRTVTDSLDSETRVEQQQRVSRSKHLWFRRSTI